MKLTIKKFQELFYISENEKSDIDKPIKLVACLIGKTPEQVEKMNVLKFNYLCRVINKKFESLTAKLNKGKPRKYVFANWRIYRLHYDVARLPINAGKYVEALTWSKDVVMNLHKIMATMAQPVRWWGKPYQRDHDKIAQDMEGIDFEVAYHAAVFFYLQYRVSMQIIQPYLIQEMITKGIPAEKAQDTLTGFMSILDGNPMPKWSQSTLEYLSNRFGNSELSDF